MNLIYLEIVNQLKLKLKLAGSLYVKFELSRVEVRAARLALECQV
jgi:hypothetical protein